MAIPTASHYFYPISKIFILPALGLGLLFLMYSKSGFYEKIHAYACTLIEKQLGTEKIVPAQEAFIMRIAQEMGISQPIIIRKMNHRALLQFGYHNAFVVFPLIMQCIPIGNTPFLFISEGFFEDLSYQEQRFLIGHEMVHIKEQHFRFLNLFFYLLCTTLLISGFFAQRYIKNSLERYSIPHQNVFTCITLSLLVCICSLTPLLIKACYRKHKEREADYQALKLLHEHNGFMKLLTRWEHEWGVPLHNTYPALFADHPSIYERKTYCLALKNRGS